MPSAQGHITVRRKAKDGADADYYELLPSLSSVTFTKGGDGKTLTPTTRTLTVQCKHITATGSEPVAVPPGYSVRYSYSSFPTSSTADLVPSGGIVISSGTSNTNIYLSLFNGSNLVDKASVPIIKGGSDGNDAVMYQLVASPANINTDDGYKTYLNDGGNAGDYPYSFTIKAYKIEGVNRSEYNGLIRVTGYGVRFASSIQYDVPVCDDVTGYGSVTISFPDNINLDENAITPPLRFHAVLSTGAGTTYRELASLDINFVYNGKQGEDGCIARTTEWAAGIEFRNDKKLVTTAIRYIDIVTVSSTNPKGRFICKETHTSESSGEKGKPTATNKYWQELNSQTPIYTPLIMADDAVLQFTQTNRILVMKQDGTTVAAGMGGATGGDNDFPLWVGATYTNRENAPFRVSLNGKLHAEEANISGTINASAGTFGKLRISDNLFDSTTGVLEFGPSYNSYTKISTSEQELAQNANIYVLNNEGGWGIYATSVPTSNQGEGHAIKAVGRVEITGNLNVIGGIVKNLHKVSSAYDVQKSDNVIVCGGSENYTLTLPKDCDDGQQFFILIRTAKAVTIKASGGDGISGTSTSITVQDKKGVILIYIKNDKTWFSGYLT